MDIKYDCYPSDSFLMSLLVANYSNLAAVSWRELSFLTLHIHSFNCIYIPLFRRLASKDQSFIHYIHISIYKVFTQPPKWRTKSSQQLVCSLPQLSPKTKSTAAADSEHTTTTSLTPINALPTSPTPTRVKLSAVWLKSGPWRTSTRTTWLPWTIPNLSKIWEDTAASGLSSLWMVCRLIYPSLLEMDASVAQQDPRHLLHGLLVVPLD